MLAVAGVPFFLAIVRNLGPGVFLGIEAYTSRCNTSKHAMLLVRSQLRSPDVFEVVVFVFGLGYGVLLAFNSMVQPLHVVELFPATVRNVGVGMSYNIGMCVFGGFAPALFEFSLNVSPLLPGVLLSIGGCVPALAILVSLRLQERGLLRLAHIRQVPYFGRHKPCKESQSDASWTLGSSATATDAEAPIAGVVAKSNISPRF